MSPPDVTAHQEHEVVAALLALRHQAGPASSGRQAPEAAWRRARLAALGLLPRFPRA